MVTQPPRMTTADELRAGAITLPQFKAVVAALGDLGRQDIEWAESLKPPTNADDFANEIVFVICNSGMKNTVARRIYERVMEVIRDGYDPERVFGHRGKCGAIRYVWSNQDRLFAEYQANADKVAFLASLPWIGPITKWHLAKNFGVDCAKPDVHLQRLADREGVTPDELCRRLATACRLRVATVDTLLWRACANGIINSRTGEIRAIAASEGGA